MVFYPTMAISVRSITAEQTEILDRRERGDTVACYRRARIVRISEADWPCRASAEALALHVESARWTIKTSNRGGIESITAPEPIFGWVNGHVLGGLLFDTIAQLQAAVERYFYQCVA
jgi:hypothetical protein